MKLNQLLKVQSKKNKRIGRGLGSGKGKTAGRGTKGQKARGTIPATFTGSLSFFKKLPLRRGKGNRQISIKPKILNLDRLNIFKAKTIVDIAKLLEEKIVSEKDIRKGIKVLATGDIKTALTIKLSVSDAARKKIEKAGGKVENV
jgi:large subunit ribosomal protein L15